MLWHRTTVSTSMAIDRDHSWASWHVFRYRTPANWNALQSHQSLTNLSIRCWVYLTALGITKEVIQGVQAALSGIVRRMLVQVTGVADRIIDWAIGRWLLWSIVAVVSVMRWVTIISLRSRMHLSPMIIVACCSSCKILQVSNHCPTS